MSLGWAAVFFGTSAAVTPSAPSPPLPNETEVVIKEGGRPEAAWRTFGGRCSGTKYEVSIWPGRRIPEAVREIKVNSRSVLNNAQHAMASWSSMEDVPIDAVIDRCERERVRVGFHLVRRSQPKQLRFYYLWLGNDGSIELLGEQ